MATAVAGLSGSLDRIAEAGQARLGDEMGGVEDGEEDAPEGGFAAGGVIPFGKGVDATSGAAAPECKCWDVKGEGKVGIGGADASFGGEAQVAIDGAYCFEEWRVVGKGGGGPLADGFYRELGGGV